jgi:hypothetical protein
MSRSVHPCSELSKSSANSVTEAHGSLLFVGDALHSRRTVSGPWLSLKGVLRKVLAHRSFALVHLVLAHLGDHRGAQRLG